MLLFFVRCGLTITAWASLKHTYLSCWEFDEKYQTTLPVFALSVEHKYKKQVETVGSVQIKFFLFCLFWLLWINYTNAIYFHKY